MREELAIFENMLSSAVAPPAPLGILRFKVEPDLLPGEFRYRLLLRTSAARKGKDFVGRLELVVNLTEEGRSAIITFPKAADAGGPAFRLSLKHFQRIEGSFRVSPKAKVDAVQVRIYENGSAAARATQSVTPG